VPVGRSQCPHCDRSIGKGRRRAKRVAIGVLAGVGAAGVSMTLMACYGAPMMEQPVKDPGTDASASPSASALPATSATPETSPSK
jgi:hypothetical protein